MNPQQRKQFLALLQKGLGAKDALEVVLDEEATSPLSKSVIKAIAKGVKPADALDLFDQDGDDDEPAPADAVDEAARLIADTLKKSWDGADPDDDDDDADDDDDDADDDGDDDAMSKGSVAQMLRRADKVIAAQEKQNAVLSKELTELKKSQRALQQRTDAVLKGLQALLKGGEPIQKSNGQPQAEPARRRSYSAAPLLPSSPQGKGGENKTEELLTKCDALIAKARDAGDQNTMRYLTQAQAELLSGADPSDVVDRFGRHGLN